MPSPGDEAPQRRWWKEPLVHFVLLGGLLFAVHAAVGGERGPEGRAPIVVSTGFVEGLAADRARRTGAAPDAEVTEGLVREFVREEALVREARRRGLDRGDPIVRRRLVQKMEFLLEGTVRVPEPTDAELRRHLERHPDAFGRSPRVGFTHVFFSRDRRDDPEGEARRALRELQDANPTPERVPERGDPFLLGADQPPRPVQRLGNTFGRAFADAIAELPEGAWRGPIESAQGWHLVRVTERTPGGVPPFDQVRDRVRAAVLKERREDAYQEALDALLARYPVERTEGDGR